MTSNYRILAEVDAGGSASVYRAHDEERGRDVALKVMEGDIDDQAAVRRFLRQAQIVGTLGGVAQVARVLDHGRLSEGALSGRPYIAFELYPGTIAHCLEHYRARPKPVAALLRDLAKAVAAAHEQGIAHGDLKPSNVLMTALDGHGEPLLTDFGAARKLDPTQLATNTHQITLRNAAPEVASGAKHYSKVRADIYGLGTILYELLVGHPPYDGPDQEVFNRLVSNEPIPTPSARGVAVPRQLELICMCCLEKRPSLRYHSAQELVDELTAFLDGRLPWIAELDGFTRLYRRCLRHPLASVLASVSLGVVLAAGAVGLWTASALERQLVENTCQANGYAAQMAAGQILNLYRGFGAALRPCSRDRTLVGALVQRRERTDAATAAALRACAPLVTFDSVLLLDVEACPRGRVPEPPVEYWERCFSFRDYIRGAHIRAQQLLAWHGTPPAQRGLEPEDFYVARALRSEGDGLFKFSLALPVFDPPLGAEGARLVGYVAATLGTDATLASFPLSSPSDRERIGAVLSLRDRERDEEDAPFPSEFRVLIHQSLHHGDAVTIATPELEQFAHVIANEDPAQRQQFRMPSRPRVATSANHHDPVAGYPGRWLAGFARVGETAQVVVVQTPYNAITTVKDYLWRVFECAVLLLAMGFGLVFIAVAALRKRAWV